MVENIISSIGRLLPRESVRDLGRLLTNAGVDVNEELGAGLAIITPAVVLILSLVALFLMNQGPTVIVFGAIGVTLVVLGAIYEILLLRIDTRKKVVEEVLPDYLQLVAANIRAGMQLDKAMWYAAKPEFGVLSKEIELASKRVFGGETIEGVLTKMSERIQSRYLTRTVDLIREGIVSGGEMASMLEKTAIDLRNMQLMQKEISASMVMYSIFIAFAAAVGAPFLYVVSYKLLGLFEKVKGAMPMDTSVSTSIVNLRFGNMGITSEQFAMFSLGMVVVTGIIACMIMAVIQTGKKRDAVKYVLPFLSVALSVFFVGRWLLDRFFGSFIL